MAAAILVLPVLYFHRAAFSDEVFITRDIQRVYYPLKQYWAERISHFQFPDWYPYDGLGQPYAGMLISGAFHPANLLYLLLPLGPALKVITLLSYMAALGGTYLFARLWGLSRGAALLAGLTYALGGYMVGISNNQLYLMAAATFPWALWGAERFLRQPSASRAAAAALPLCLVLFSGDPQSFALCNGMVLVLVLLRPDRAGVLRAAPRAGWLIVLGALLAAVQLLSLLSTLRNAYPTARTLLIATRFSFHPLRLLELVMGPLFIHPETGQVASSTMATHLLHSPTGSLWVYSVYMGLPALLLLGGALWAGRRNPLTWKVAGVALLILVLAMGRNLPLYQWCYDWLPLWKSFRYPEKLLPYFLFPCALGAGAGLEAVLRDSALARRLAQAGFVLAVCFGLLALGEWRLRLFSDGVVGALWDHPLPDILEMLRGNFIQAALLAAGTLAAVGMVLLLTHQPIPRAAAVLGIQFAVLYLANERTYQLTYPEVLEQPTGMVSAILSDQTDASAGPPRVYGGVEELMPSDVPPEGLRLLDVLSLNIAAALEPDTPALWHLESARPYLPAVSARVGGLTELEHPLDLWLGRLAGLYHVGYLTVGSQSYMKSGANRKVILAEDPRLQAVLVRNPRTLPRAYLGTPRCVPDQPTALQLILSGDFQPGRDVALECPPDEAQGAV
ncbi:MAG: hypothetical protein ACXU86_04810, partial [Archangium sp.]